MEIKELEHGIHPDGCKYRIRYINGIWYYSTYEWDGRNGWLWRVRFTSINRRDVVNFFIKDGMRRE